MLMEIGNLVRDPEVRNTSGGTPVCNATLAINNKVKKGDKWVNKAVFVDITVWGSQGEAFAKYHKKGSQVVIEGHLDQDEWDDAKTGQKRTKLKIVVDRWHFAGAKSEVSDEDSGDKQAPF